MKKVYETAIVYKITNTVNNKVYIGSTVQGLEDRWDGHSGFSHMACYRDTSNTSPLYEDMRKYGPDKFEKEILLERQECTQHEIQLEEDKLIKEYWDSLGESTMYNRMRSAFTHGDTSHFRSDEAHSKRMSKITETYGGYGKLLNSNESVQKRTNTNKENKTGIFRDDNYKLKSHKYIVEGKEFYGLSDLTKGLNEMGYELSYGVVHHITNGYASKRTLKKYPNILNLITRVNKNEWKKENE